MQNRRNAFLWRNDGSGDRRRAGDCGSDRSSRMGAGARMAPCGAFEIDRGSSMTADRYQRVKDIFNQVLDTLPADRESILSGRCSGDEELESEVRRVLAQLEIESGGVLDSPIIDGAELDSLIDRYELSFEPGEIVADRFRIYLSVC